MAHELILQGCTPTPLASYLKALAVLRLLGEQKPEWKVTGCWRDDCFTLRSSVFTDKEEQNRHILAEFFLHKYAPTPVLSPWNGRAGYLEGDDADQSTRSGAVLLNAFRKAKGKRFNAYHQLIDSLDNNSIIIELNVTRAKLKTLEDRKKNKSVVWTDNDQDALKETKAKYTDEKEILISNLRAKLDETQIDWLDAVIALGEGRAYAPLLGGSGGVEGSMDLGVNMMENLERLFSLADGSPSVNSKTWFLSSFFAVPSIIGVNNTAGSLCPEGLGGVNAGTGFTANGGINPWDYVLMIEGAIIFYPTLTKKLESTALSKMSYPFSVDPLGTGSASVAWSDERRTRSGKSEVWMPLWARPVNYAEIKSIFREGSVTIGRLRPQNGLDFVRAISQLGVDRGLNAFQRFQFLTRSGDNDIAVPLVRVNVRKKPVKSDYVSDLDRKDRNAWLTRFRSLGRDKNASKRIASLAGRLDDALFNLALRKDDAYVVQEALVLLGEVQTTMSLSSKARDEKKGIAPVPLLGRQWAVSADDGSKEFRIASALVGLIGEKESPMPLACHIWPVHPRTRQWMDVARKRNPSDTTCSHRFHVPQGRNLYAFLSDILERRLLLADRLEFNDKPLRSNDGCNLETLAAFLSGEVDNRRVYELMLGLALVENSSDDKPGMDASLPARGSIPAAFAAMKLLFLPDDTLQWYGVLPKDAHCPIPSGMVRLLRANRNTDALRLATRRLRASGITFDMPGVMLPNISGEQLAAALLLPLSASAIGTIINRFVAREDRQTA